MFDLKELFITICTFDGKTLAVDSRVTMGGIVSSDNYNKMFEIEHPELGYLVGVVTGALDFVGPWMAVIEEHGFVPLAIPGMDDDYSLSGLFVDTDGNCWQASTNGSFFLWGKEPTALGSAIGVAHYLLIQKKKSALATAQEVCKANLFCGGAIRVYNPKTGKITIH